MAVMLTKVGTQLCWLSANLYVQDSHRYVGYSIKTSAIAITTGHPLARV